MFETKRRSLAKALSWRVFATIITGTIVFVLTGKSAFALEVGAVDTGIKLLVYFFHERLWLHIPFGRVPPQDFEI